jgi:hypothetical protein
MTAYKQIYKVSTFRSEESVKNLYILLVVRAGVRAQVHSVHHYTATHRKNRVALEKLKLAPVLDTGNPKIATRLRYEKNLHWQFVPSSGKNERTTTAPLLGDGETQTIRPTFLHKNASNVILFAIFPLSLPSITSLSQQICVSDTVN